MIYPRASQEATRWFRSLSMVEQNRLLEKYFPGRDKTLLVQNSRNIQEMYEKEKPWN